MLWWFAVGCFVLTDRDIQAHDRAVHAAEIPQDTGPGLVSLSVLGDGLSGLKGYVVYGLLRRGDTPVATDHGKIVAGSFALDFPEALEIGERYRVDLLIDLDGDGVCTDGTDGTYRIPNLIPEDPDDLEADLNVHQDFEPDACGSFE